MGNDLKADYTALVSRLEENSRLAGVMGLLHWDREVMMPPGAVDSRARQMSALAGVVHEKSTDPQMGEILDKLHNSGPNGFSAIEWCNIREAKREYDIETKVPKELVMELADLSSRGHSVWATARKENRFEDFAPTLARLIKIKKQWAGYVYPDLEPYDANIDIYERGMTMAQIDPVFKQLKERLVPLIRAIGNSGYQPDASFLKGDFPIERQENLGREISREMGFSFDHGRMDVSVHPFCGGPGPSDVRITTRYRTDNFIESLYAVIHETGHGLYEQGRMEDGRDQPVSESLTMAIHESQSLFWERMVAQSLQFCNRYLETIARAFPRNFDGVSARQMYEAVNVCRPSFIRVEADEVTYPMHIILRYELEKGLFDGSVEVDRLPDIWNDKMEEYLGIRPPDDSRGVLQDVHWSGGAFGYFPSYTLGAMYACQFYQAVRREISDLEDKIERGDFAPIKSWLNEKIHRQGRLYTPDELVQRVTGEPLNPDVFLSYLENKYGALYRLN